MTVTRCCADLTNKDRWNISLWWEFWNMLAVKTRWKDCLFLNTAVWNSANWLLQLVFWYMGFFFFPHPSLPLSGCLCFFFHFAFISSPSFISLLFLSSSPSYTELQHYFYGVGMPWRQLAWQYLLSCCCCCCCRHSLWVTVVTVMKYVQRWNMLFRVSSAQYSSRVLYKQFLEGVWSLGRMPTREWTPLNAAFTLNRMNRNMSCYSDLFTSIACLLVTHHFFFFHQVRGFVAIRNSWYGITRKSPA